MFSNIPQKANYIDVVQTAEEPQPPSYSKQQTLITMSSSSSPPLPRGRPHVLLVCAPFQGHVNPLLALARHLASRGLLVTFATAPHAGLKFAHADGAAVDVGPGPGTGTIRFAHLRGGALWAPDDPRYSSSDVLRHLDEAAPPVLAELIRAQSSGAGAGRPVSCVVVTAFAPWATRVAAGMGLPHAMLFSESCAVLSLFYHHFHSLAEFIPAREAGPTATVSVPGLPPLAAGDLPALIHAPEEFVWRQVLVADLRSLRETVTWVLVNTFDDLERPAIEALRPHLPVIPVGPLCCDGDGDEDEDDDGVAAWLDAQPPRSVVYVAFGSLLRLSRDEMSELAAGLAATGRPFLLAVRDDNREGGGDGGGGGGGESSRGKVVAWCEQARVLAHGAVGCFVTHCGWNSTVEALAAGVPVVTYPAWADQPTNAKFLADVYGVGVRLPRPMARDALRRCVDEVMDDGPEAAAVRARSGEWKAKATAAMSAGGSLDKGIQEFVAAIQSTSTCARAV